MELKTIYQSNSSFYVFSKDLNYGGTLFGGKIMAELDLESSKVARSLVYDTNCDNCVTASFERIDFKSPAKLGDLIHIESDIISLGRTSLRIKTSAFIKNGIDKNNWKEICTATCTFVCLKEGVPTPHLKLYENICI